MLQQLRKLEALMMNINDTVLDELNHKPFYTVWKEQFDRMQVEDGGDIAMVRLLKIAEQEYSPEFQQLDQMALEVIVSAKQDFQHWEDELYNSRENNRKMSYDDVDKPAEMYRRWMKPLRFVQQFNYDAGDIICDLQEIQSLPFGELDNPDWIDPYTGEVAPIEERIEFCNAPKEELVFNKLSVDAFTKRMVDIAKEMNVNPEFAEKATRIFFSGAEADELVRHFIYTFENELARFKHLLTVEAETLRASESFDASDGLDDMEFIVDDIDVRQPDFMVFQEDMRMKNYFSLRYEIEDIIKGLRQEISDAAKMINLRKEIAFRKLRKVYDEAVVREFLDTNESSPAVKNMLKVLGMFAINTKREIFSGVKEQVLSSTYASEFMEKLQDFVDREEHTPDVVLLFLSFQNGLCFQEEDAARIKVPNYGTLLEYIDIHGDEILENFNDPSGIKDTEPSWEFIQDFAETVAEEYGKTGVPLRQQDRSKVNPFNTPEFIEGTIKAASTLKNVTKESLASYAWEYMREHISPRGNALYHNIVHQGGDRKAAMRAFYTQAFKESRIKSIRPEGVVLDTGRVINWSIAKRKIELNEIAFDNGDKPRLKNVLRQKGWGREVQSIL